MAAVTICSDFGAQENKWASKALRSKAQAVKPDSSQKDPETLLMNQKGDWTYPVDVLIQNRDFGQVLGSFPDFCQQLTQIRKLWKSRAHSSWKTYLSRADTWLYKKSTKRAGQKEGQKDWVVSPMPLDSKEIKPIHPKENQPWIFIGRTDVEAAILWPPDLKSWLIGKDPDARKDWRQEDKEAAEGEMFR